MKKSVMLALCLAIGMLLVTSMAFAYTLNSDNGSYVPGLGIAGSPHDLSSTGQGVLYGDTNEQAGLNRICIYCHAPHNTMSSTQATAAGITYFPLWNHEVTMGQYGMYTNGTDMPSNTSHQSQAMAYLQSTNSTRPGSVSRLCLSCHDGTVSTNSYGVGNAFNGQSSHMTGAAKNVRTGGQTKFLIGGTLGNDLSNHHPIGFPYAQTDVDNEIAKTDATMGTGGLHISDLLWKGNMECTTCHDVHNSKNTGEKFLWISDANSAFCGTCHLKL
jgi:predicted CXXCH cytochrome family protein